MVFGLLISLSSKQFNREVVKSQQLKKLLFQFSYKCYSVFLYYLSTYIVVVEKHKVISKVYICHI